MKIYSLKWLKFLFLRDKISFDMRISFFWDTFLSLLAKKKEKYQNETLFLKPFFTLKNGWNVFYLLFFISQKRKKSINENKITFFVSSFLFFWIVQAKEKKRSKEKKTDAGYNKGYKPLYFLRLFLKPFFTLKNGWNVFCLLFIRSINSQSQFTI